MDQSVPQPRSATATLVPFAAIIFFGYATIGLPLSTLPLQIHTVLGFGTTMVGLAIGLAPAMTLLTRQLAGRFADRRGPRLGALLGLAAASASGVAYAASLLLPPGPALGVILVGRALAGVGDSFVTTSIIAWSVGAVGAAHAGRAMSWSGIAMYGAMAAGAPVGVGLAAWGGFAAVSWAVIAAPVLGVPIAFALRNLVASHKASIRMWPVMGKMWPPGLAMVLASSGFGTIAAFLALRYQSLGWTGAGFALTGFGALYILSRLLFAGLPDRFGGITVAMICLVGEAIGLVLIAAAPSPAFAFLGTAMTGLGYSMVFPSLGVEVVRRVTPETRGVALGAFLACFDLGMGAAGPVMGMLAAGSGLAAAFVAAAGAALVALVLVWTTRVR